MYLFGLTVPTPTDDLCGSDVATTLTPKQCDSTSLSLVTLKQYRYTENGNDDVLIRLLGPIDPAKASNLIITVPHGGSLKPSYIGDRTTSDPTYCDPTCVITKDSYTKEISELLTQKMIDNYCQVPYVIINELHRSKLDANREEPEATFNDPVAIIAWHAFHSFVADAQTLVSNKFGTVVNTEGIEGIKGLLFDAHGYAGTDWETDGGKFIQWGYRLSTTTMDQVNGILDDNHSSSSTIGSLTHARHLPGESIECLVRGPKSLGQRLNGMLPLDSSVEMCGAGLPSYDYQNPIEIVSDPQYCSAASSSGDCHYYSGGVDIRIHERMDWDSDPNFTGIHMNAVQAEMPRCIRFAGGTSESRAVVHGDLANKLSIALYSFISDLYTDGPTSSPTKAPTPPVNVNCKAILRRKKCRRITECRWKKRKKRCVRRR